MHKIQQPIKIYIKIKELSIYKNRAFITLLSPSENRSLEPDNCYMLCLYIILSFQNTKKKMRV